MTLIRCPGCGEIAEVIERFELPSTDGPVQHVRTHCLRRHWYMTPIPDVEGID
jgi:hypothetical protein